MFEKFAPIVVTFLIGIAARRLGWLSQKTANEFLRFIYYICAPCLIIPAFASLNLSKSIIAIPLCALLVVLGTYLAWRLLSLALHIPKESFGVCLIGSLIMNIGFVLPFVYAFYPPEGLAYLFLFDSVNGSLTYSFVYFLASRHSAGSQKISDSWRKILASPVNWSILLGIVLAITHTPLPPLVEEIMTPLGKAAIPLVMVSLGLYFTLGTEKWGLVLLTSAMRTGLGVLIGWIAIQTLGLSGLAATIVLLCCAAPVGVNTLTFSSLEKLDTELAAKAVSTSILLGFLYLPLLIFLL